MSTVAADQIPAWAARYIGIPYVDRGRSLEGADCWGLVVLVYRDTFNITLPSYEARYRTSTDRVSVSRLFFEEATSARWRRVPLTEAQMADVLMTWVVDKTGRHQHVGVFLTPDRFLHILAGRETCVERLRPHWYDRIEAVYRNEALVIA